MSPFFSASSASFACSFIQFFLSYLMLLFILLLISAYCFCVLILCCLDLLQFTFSLANFLLSIFFPCLLRDPFLFLIFSKTQDFLTCFYTYIYIFIAFQLSAMSVSLFWVDSTENLFFSSNLNSSLTLGV